MPVSKGKGNVEPRGEGKREDTVPADFPAEFGGEFQSLSQQLCANLGTLAGLALVGGGYFGISITDDGGSIRLAVRSGSFQFDKRFYSLAKFEGATAWLARRLEELRGS